MSTKIDEVLKQITGDVEATPLIESTAKPGGMTAKVRSTVAWRVFAKDIEIPENTLWSNSFQVLFKNQRDAAEFASKNESKKAQQVLFYLGVMPNGKEFSKVVQHNSLGKKNWQYAKAWHGVFFPSFVEAWAVELGLLESNNRPVKAVLDQIRSVDYAIYKLNQDGKNDEAIKLAVEECPKFYGGDEEPFGLFWDARVALWQLLDNPDPFGVKPDSMLDKLERFMRKDWTTAVPLRFALVPSLRFSDEGKSYPETALLDVLTEDEWNEQQSTQTLPAGWEDNRDAWINTVKDWKTEYSSVEAIPQEIFNDYGVTPEIVSLWWEQV